MWQQQMCFYERHDDTARNGGYKYLQRIRKGNIFMNTQQGAYKVGQSNITQYLYFNPALVLVSKAVRNLV